MDEPEAFIITVKCADGKVEMDLELPAELSINEVRVKLLDVLKSQYPGQFDSWNKCHLRYRCRMLQDGETLAKVGAFDGSCLDIIK